MRIGQLVSKRESSCAAIVTGGKGPVINNKKRKNEKLKKNISLEQLLSQAGGSIFRLARMAMIRAKEIHLGSVPLVECRLFDKETTIALKEISEGEVSLMPEQKSFDKTRQKGETVMGDQG